MRFVIYTVLTGCQYDKIMQPEVVDEDIDYILFTDNKGFYNEYEGCWRIEEIPFECPDKGRLSRFPKLQPHYTVLKQYDFSLYIDANIKIIGRYVYDRMRELAEENVGIALLQHPFRDCVYQEAYICIAACKGGWLDILRQVCFLKNKNIPKHGGLYEANLIFRNHNDGLVLKTDNIWWQTFMKYSKRDQLSLVYALKKTSIRIEYFMPKGFSTRNHPAFDKIVHLPQKEGRKTKMKRTIVSIIYHISKTILKERNL